MSWGAAEALPWVLSLSFAVTWLRIAMLARLRRGSVTLMPVQKISKPLNSDSMDLSLPADDLQPVTVKGWNTASNGSKHG